MIRLVIIGIGGAILGAALLLPAAELSQRATRESGDLDFANTHALPPAQFLSALALPDLFGNPKTPPSYYWGADFYEEFTAYAGLLPLLAIPLAIRLRRRETAFFLGLIALGLVLSLGVGGALMPLLVRWVPGYGLFRVPARALLLVVIGMAGLTALLISALQTSSPDERRALLQPGAAPVDPGGGGGAVRAGDCLLRVVCQRQPRRADAAPRRADRRGAGESGGDPVRRVGRAVAVGQTRSDARIPRAGRWD